MKSKIILRKHLVTISLVFALVIAVFVNWYYTNNEENVTEPPVTDEVNIGDAQYVNSDSLKNEDDYFNDAEINRTKAHDSAVEYLEEIINDQSSDNDTKSLARERLVKISEQIKLESDMATLISAQINTSCVVTYDGETVEVILPKGTINNDVLIKIKDIVISKTSLTAECITIIELK